MKMTQQLATRIAAGFGFLAVCLGAFGAHALKYRLALLNTGSIWETAVFYHLVHAVMLFILAGRKPFPALSWWSFLIGIVLFSGSLYALAYTHRVWFGGITPFGGAAFLVGWGALICCKKYSDDDQNRP
jgi:uncharacterized membrane protein YgdD (TMEM256/DUF423 family)